MKHPYMTAKEVADHTRLAKSTIYLMVERNEIPHIKFGRRVLFDTQEIHTWLEQKKTPAQGS